VTVCSTFCSLVASGEEGAVAPFELWTFASFAASRFNQAAWRPWRLGELGVSFRTARERGLVLIK